LDYLGLDDDCYRKMLSWSMIILHHCPVNLTDIINPKAQSAREIWEIVLTENGLLSARTGGACQVRLSEESRKPLEVKPAASQDSKDAPEESDSPSPFRSTTLVYRVGEGAGDMRRLGKTWFSPILMWSWRLLHSVICVVELLAPPIFFCINDPCYAPTPHATVPSSLLSVSGGIQSHYVTAVRLAVAGVAAGGDLAAFAPFATSAEAPGSLGVDAARLAAFSSAGLTALTIAPDGSVGP
jgi:hypothetical protein